MRFSIFFLFLILCATAVCQNKEIDFSSPDSLYREDQFYVGISYSNLQNPPSGFNQFKISSNVIFGFLRDMPINKNRTWSIATGLGYKISVMNHNLSVAQTENGNVYSILNTDFDKNKNLLHYLELPLEIRWRASTPESHKFWRIYTGFKLGYLVYDKYKYDGVAGSIRERNNNDLDKIQYGVYLSSGWNTWNVYIYYGLNPIFKSAEIDGQKIKLNDFNVGLMFYIL